MAECTGNNVTLTELTRALGELRVAIAEDFKATISELDTKIESTIQSVASLPVVPVPGPGQRPHPVITCCHSFKTKDHMRLE